MRAWFAGPAASRPAGDAVRGDGDLLEVPDCTSVGRAVDSFVAWSHGRQVLTAPELLRAVDFAGVDVVVRPADIDALAGANDAAEAGVAAGAADAIEVGNAGGANDVEIVGERATVVGAVAVERVLGTYPPTFERLFEVTDADLCIRRRGGGDLFLDGKLVSVSG